MPNNYEETLENFLASEEFKKTLVAAAHWTSPLVLELTTSGFTVWEKVRIPQEYQSNGIFLDVPKMTTSAPYSQWKDRELDFWAEEFETQKESLKLKLRQDLEDKLIGH